MEKTGQKGLIAAYDTTVRIGKVKIGYQRRLYGVKQNTLIQKRDNNTLNTSGLGYFLHQMIEYSNIGQYEIPLVSVVCGDGIADILKEILFAKDVVFYPMYMVGMMEFAN
jgi:hypothetical protein